MQRKRPSRGLRDLLRFVFRQRAAPEEIALGVAIGLVIAFSPTVGFQIPLALLMATVFKANRMAALLPIWVTNVFTIPPVYGFTYRIGHYFLPSAEPRKVRHILERLRDDIAEHGFYDVAAMFRSFGRMSWNLLIPMFIGGLIVGILAAALAYPLVLYLARRLRRRRALRLRMRAEERRGKPGPGANPDGAPRAGSPLSNLRARREEE